MGPTCDFLLQNKGPDFIQLELALHLNSSHWLQTTSYGYFNPVSHSGRSQCLTIIDPRISTWEVLASSVVEWNIVTLISQTTCFTSEFQSVVNECLKSLPQNETNSTLANIVSPTPQLVDVGENSSSQFVTVKTANSTPRNEKTQRVSLRVLKILFG